MFSYSLPVLALAAFGARAAPVRRQAANADVTVLQFAHVLEQLETEFYKSALTKFQANDFISAGFALSDVPVGQFSTIADDESTHTTILESAITALGAQPVSGCTFDFGATLDSVGAMAPVARLVEAVGVSAYLGAAHLVTDPHLLTAAASILTVEARHQTTLNLLNGGTGISNAFDIPLLPNHVLALAGGFIKGCDVGIPSNKPLTITNTDPVTIGSTLQFDFDGLADQDRANLSCQMMVGGSTESLSLPIDQCTVPDGINGLVYIYVTNNTQPLLNNPVDQFQGNILAGPTGAFFDTAADSLAGLVSGKISSTTTTSTVTPPEASQVADQTGTNTDGAPAPAPTAAQDNKPSTESPDGSVEVIGMSRIPKPATGK